MGRFKIAFPYLLFALMACGVWWSNVRSPRTEATPVAMQEVGASDAAERLLDPVCNMDVNASWGFTHEYQGQQYYFCAQRCVEDFASDPDKYMATRCMVCNEPVDPTAALPATYLENTYYLCTDEHRSEFKADPAGFFMHRMWGIPDWMYYLSIASILLVSFLMFEGRSVAAPAMYSGEKSQSKWTDDRFDLLSIGVLRTLLFSRITRFVCQLVMVGMFLLIIAAGLFGNQNPGLNIAPLLTWTVWWGGIGSPDYVCRQGVVLYVPVGRDRRMDGTT